MRPLLPESEPATARAASSVRGGGGRRAGYPGSGRRNIPPGRAPSGGPGCMGRGAAGGSGRRLPALPPCPERRLSRVPARGRGAREGAEEGPAAGRERQGSSTASPLPLPARPPAAAAATAALRHRPGEAGRAGPSRPPRRARPCPVSPAATDSRPPPAPPLGMCGAPRPAGTRLGSVRLGSVRFDSTRLDWVRFGSLRAAPAAGTAGP